MADLDKLTVAELRELAKKSKIKGFTTLKRAELLAALSPAPKSPKSAPKASGAPKEKPAVKAKPTPKAKPAVKAKPAPKAVVKKEATPGKMVEPKVEQAPVSGADIPPEGTSVWEVTAAKFNARVVAPAIPNEDLGSLPSSYAEDRLVIVPRDPEWMFVYWELTEATYRQTEERAPGGRTVLRISTETGSGAAVIADHDVSLGGGRYYARNPGTENRVIAELGILGAGGSFVPMVRSAPTPVPIAGPRTSEPVFMTVPFDVPIRTLMQKGHLAGGSYVSAEGKLLTEAEYRRLFGESVPGSQHR